MQYILKINIKKSLLLFFLFGVGLLLSSCGTQSPAPIEYKQPVSVGEYRKKSQTSNKEAKKKVDDYDLWDDMEHEEMEDAGQDGQIIYHKVQDGETVGSIAKKYGVTKASIIDMNDLLPPYFIEEDEILLIKKVKKIAKVKKTYLVDGQAGKTSLIAPIKGEVISRYGEKTKKFSKSGILVKASLSQPVRSALAGAVKFVGKNEKFGNYIIISSKDNMNIAYGHMSNITISKASTIKKGQIIGYAGKSGACKTPCLYLAIKKDGVHIDPLKYLAYQTK